MNDVKKNKISLFHGQVVAVKSYYPVLGYNNNNRFLSQQLTFSSPSQHFLGIPSFLLPLARKLPFIRRPNYCIVVWLQLICWLVLLASLSLLLTGCPWFTNTGVFVDTQGMESRYQAMYCVGCLC